ncbi:hypothetical protein F5X68DRAFT_267652 [Plectosphaerella plurivora]|uniref:Glycosyltransferase family 28 N-terminal domain-containing protein n=1 Tax=Plectosphaerella plurivora TaxID=936078 RepID=A0A9P9AAS2_9PEZI|nr:hypothetical protein F5X68DRAFT_267652 [Plectosphaerella plurivora]
MSSQGSQLNVLIQVVGSRGDVQPFIALGCRIQKLGFRVRLATHDMFEDFVLKSGLEFFPIGGDPAALMAYMVKNPGLIPSMESLQAGEVGQKREMMEEMLEGFWASCVQPYAGVPFVADAIIANPPAFAHVHCAQVLGIPVHIMFTMPWSPTRSFSHPLANISNNSGSASTANYATFGIVEYLTWQGLGDVINKWRRSIDLEDVAMFDGPLLADRLRIPFTYCWSPALVPKPKDWGSYIDVCGFFFRDSPQYSPPEDLARFLAAGPAPVYIGFGSIVLDNPEAVISVILDAVKAAGVRAIISKGWSDLGGTAGPDVYWIGDCPHEWLFGQVAAVVHHGGAGTTACGLRNGVPTTIVPFFGDQPFWGEMVAKAGAGADPIPISKLNATNLSEAITYCLTKEAKAAADDIARKMAAEDGVETAVQSWLRQLPKTGLQCDLVPGQPAAWVYKKSKKPIKLSKLAAEQLITSKAVQEKHLQLYQTKAIHIETTRWDPVSGGASAVMATAVDMADSITGMVTKPVEEYHYEKRRRERAQKREAHASGSATPRSSVGGQQDTDKLSVTGSEHGSKKQGSMAGKVAGASAKSIGMLGPTAAKGMLVDIPLAITEGLRAVPSHFGTKSRDHGKVTDSKSGAVVAGKTFAWGFVDGLSDLVMEPVRGGAKEGAMGVVKGAGKGAVSLVAKSGAGMFGLFAYPSAGIAKSIRAATHGGTKKAIGQARRGEGRWLLEMNKSTGLVGEDLVGKFERLKKAA